MPPAPVEALETGTKLPVGNTWLFPEREFLKSSPSRKQLTIAQDLKTRESIHDFVIRLGTALRVDGPTILAATIYINRFYVRMPITTSKYFVACAAMSISCKLNDNYRAPDKIAMAGCTIKNPHKVIDEQSTVFWHWRDQLLFREELILKNLNFELNLDLPYDLRRPLEEYDHSEDGHEVFFEKLPEIIRNAISSVEILSSLPITVAYDMPTILAAALVLTICDAEARFPDLSYPLGYLQKCLQIDLDWCYHCYLYILKLLDLGKSSDPKLASNRNADKKVKRLSKEQFYKYK